MFNPDYPIVLGLVGGIATGKTSAADGLAPMAAGDRNPDTGEEIKNTNPISWTHLYFSIPLYRMATARQKITGDDATDRMYYEVHDALVDLFKGYITYEETVEAVYDIVHMDCPREGKPRQFLQYVGTEICRNFDFDCFVKWMNRKIKEEHVRFEQEQDRKEELHELANPDEAFYRKHFGVVISDIRFKNECEFVRKQPNGVLVRLTAHPEVVMERVAKRDGALLASSEKVHASEKALKDLPEEWFDAVIDTSDITPLEKLQQIYQTVRDRA